MFNFEGVVLLKIQGRIMIWFRKNIFHNTVTNIHFILTFITLTYKKLWFIKQSRKQQFDTAFSNNSDQTKSFNSIFQGVWKISFQQHTKRGYLFCNFAYRRSCRKYLKAFCKSLIFSQSKYKMRSNPLWSRISYFFNVFMRWKPLIL